MNEALSWHIRRCASWGREEPKGEVQADEFSDI